MHGVPESGIGGLLCRTVRAGSRRRQKCHLIQIIANGESMKIVKYPRYIEYERQRIQANDTMMGLLVGSKLALQTLNLTAGSNILLSDIFPSVPHIKRFNLTTGNAQRVLSNSEELLGVLSVPQVMGLHEDLILGMLNLMKDNVNGVGSITSGVNMSNIHEKFERSAGGYFNADSLSLFHLIRLSRNSHIHNGGNASRALVEKLNGTEDSTFGMWEDITGMNFPLYEEGDEVHLGIPELIGTLALTKRLAEEANVMLQGVLPREVWSKIVVEHWRDVRKPGNENQQRRQLIGLARMNYGAIGLTLEELHAARESEESS